MGSDARVEEEEIVVSANVTCGGIVDYSCGDGYHKAQFTGC